MKKLILMILLLTFYFLVGCSNEEADEIITHVGLEEAQIIYGEEFDLFSGVIFTSTTQGDITDTVEITGDANISQLGVHIITYQTHFENDELYSVERRLVVLNPPLDDDEAANLLSNGDFSDTMNNWGVERHASYPDSVDFIIDPDLKRMQIIMESASTMMAYPNLNQSQLTLEDTNSYEISLLVSGTEQTFFTIEIVELNQTNQVLNTIMEPETINVTIQDGQMYEVSFTFTPLTSSTNATMRIMFGQDDGSSPSGEIYIDNVMLTLVTS